MNHHTTTFKEATEDLVATIQEAVQSNELPAKDREWLIGELDELIAGLKQVKGKLGRNGEEKGKLMGAVTFFDKLSH